MNSERGELVMGSDPLGVGRSLTLRPVIRGERRSGFYYTNIYRLVCKKLSQKLPIVSQRAKNIILIGCDGRLQDNTSKTPHALGHGSR